MHETMTISPYRDCGAWVFDDPEAGLEKEPLVRGVDAMLDIVADALPGGFDLVFRGIGFPYSSRFDRVREEDGWNLYRNGEWGVEGWLCPALLKYFPEGAPEELHVWAMPYEVDWRDGHALVKQALLAAGRRSEREPLFPDPPGVRRRPGLLTWFGRLFGLSGR